MNMPRAGILPVDANAKLAAAIVFFVVRQAQQGTEVCKVACTTGSIRCAEMKYHGLQCGRPHWSTCSFGVHPASIDQSLAHAANQQMFSHRLEDFQGFLP
jgi:hypothetical protein